MYSKLSKAEVSKEKQRGMETIWLTGELNIIDTAISISVPLCEHVLYWFQISGPLLSLVF